ncbi:MAG TPA: metalloregulator ArsR/SmtB family transcription factor [Candidatus Nanoarchaeia archaeon]|nr:metalloregulator ArsR/SmtB family transcription factor [Candidatus Nanoarchaeia archaeon]
MTNKSILQHCHKEGISEPELYDAYKVFFGTLVSQSRLRIINLLKTGKKNVSQIMESLHMDQTNVSHDLARLRRCGFVISEVKGKFRNYRLNEATIKPLMHLIDTHMSQYCVHILRGETA